MSIVKFPICLSIILCLIQESDSYFDGENFKGSSADFINEKPCVRLFSNEGDIGCRTPSRRGSSGALYAIRTLSDVISARKIAIAFVVVMPGKYFNSTIINSIKINDKLAGIIIVDDEASWSSAPFGDYSVDVVSPQGTGTTQSRFTINADYKWNSRGNGIAYQSFAFPIVRADMTESEKLERYCNENIALGFDSSRLNNAEFTYYMGGEGITSKRCLEWKNLLGYREPRCLPVGGQSVWGSLGTLNQNPKVMVTVGIDSVAEFHDLAFGANDAAASIAALLGAVEALSRAPRNAFQKQPVFFFANAEEWGYAGSRRFAEDLLNFNCTNPVHGNKTVSGLPLCAAPVRPSTVFQNILHGKDGVDVGNLESILALDQIGKAAGSFFAHSLQPAEDNPVVSALKSAAQSVGASVSVTLSEAEAIPPTPMTTFALLSEAWRGGVVLSGYGESFLDPLYHTRLDNGSHVSLADVVSAASLTASSVYALCTADAASGAPAVNASLIEAILNCLTEDWACPEFEAYQASERKEIQRNAGLGGLDFGVGASPPNYYAGVLTASGAGGGQPVVNHNGVLYGRFEGKWRAEKSRAFAVPNALVGFLRAFLAHHLGDRGDNPQSCDWSRGHGVSGTSSSSGCGFCSVLSNTNVTMECIRDTCVCPSAFYHVALDPGIEADVTPSTFIVVNTSTPSYTEPYWSDLQLSVYSSCSKSVTWLAVITGAIVATTSAVGSFYAHQWLDFAHLL